MADPVKKPVELIPVFRDSFPRRLCRVEFQMTFFLVVIAPLNFFFSGYCTIKKKVYICTTFENNPGFLQEVLKILVR